VSIDALTGLAGHARFHGRLRAELQRAAAAGEPLAVVSFDLDDFAGVNEANGHDHGDEVLRVAGNALREAVRRSDFAARVGGDEFALIISGGEAARAVAVAERAREAVVTRLRESGHGVGLSAGVAAFPADAEKPNGLWSLACEALSSAKRAGKGRTVRFRADRAAAAGPSQLHEFAALLARPDPVEPVFQPIADLVTGRLAGYEALARFPALGGRSPEVVFAQAHACGLGPELEAAAVRAALQPGGRSPEAHLSLNVSPSALVSPIFQHELPTNLDGIVIEITEHEVVGGNGALDGVLSDLRARGAKVAVDDAGAGYAGLTQLMSVRPDIVKLDRALIDGLHADAARMALVESFVRFARGSGATVCAEGIETLDDLVALADLDVEFGQGYALARPRPPWTSISEDAAAACASALAEALSSMPPEGHPVVASDRRLVHVSARLASARSRDDLVDALRAVAAELRAEEVSLSRWHPRERVLQTLAESAEGWDVQEFAIDAYPTSERVIRDQVAIEIAVGDPASDRAEVELLLGMGYGSLLMLPVVSRGATLGLLEVFRRDERPWVRAEINRARVISNQLASVIHALLHTGAAVA
jgi:diguanylate cyclase (GGDEF)-like protein